MNHLHRFSSRVATAVSGVLAAAAIGFSGTVVADEFAEYRDYFEPLPALPPIPADNSLTKEKIELGKMLFFEPRISASGVISCATCHNPALGWTDPDPAGHRA